MTPELAFLLAIVLFWATLYVIGRLFRLDKHGLEIRPAYLTYKSRWLKELLGRVSKTGRIFWRALCNVGLVLAVGLMVFSVYFLINNLLRFVYPLGETTPVFLVLPGVTIRLHWLPYFFTATAVVIVTHELAHGVAALVEGVPVKSAGGFLFLVFFGGFVEPDRKRFEETSMLSKLRILSAGSSTNLVIGVLALLLLTSLYAPASGIVIHETTGEGPADRAGLQGWDVIYAMNGTIVFTVQDFSEYMGSVKPGETLILSTSRGNILVNTERGSRNQSITGLLSFSNYYPSRLRLEPLTAIHLYMSLQWTLLIAWSVAVFNMLPMYPWDGEKFLYHALEGFVKNKRREARLLINAVFWSLITANMMLTFIKYGWVSI